MINSIQYNEDHIQFQHSISQFLEKEVTPFYNKWEQDGKIPRDLWNKMGSIGMLCPHIDEKYGGLKDYSFNVVVTETLCKHYATSIAVGMTIHSDIVATYIEKYGSEEQKEYYLPKMVSGEIVAALGMTEPNAGSDLVSIQTHSKDDGDNLVVNGSKIFITNGYHADVILTAVRTDGEGAAGVSLVLIDTKTKGVNNSTLLKKIGLKSQDTCQIFFDDVVVPITKVLGTRGHGFFHMMNELPRERLALSVGAVASSRQILEDTIRYVKERTAFGRPICGFQNTQFEIADMDAYLSSVEAFSQYCTSLALQDKLDTITASKLKIVATETQCKVVDRCLQLHGGYGFMSEYPVARAYCDGRVQRIYGGTNEIMKLLISRDIFSHK